MSYNLTSWAWSVTGLSTAEKITLLALADACNGKQRSITCYPSISKIQQQTALSKRAVQRALAALENRALISRTLGTGRTTTMYKLACVDSTNCCLDLDDPTCESFTDGRHSGTPAVPDRHPRGVTVAPQGCHSGAQGCHSDTQTRKEPGIEPVIPLGIERESQSKKGVDTMCLSQFPQGELVRIAAEARPDLPDFSPVLAKFAAHVNGATYPPVEWERRWRLWLLNERVPRSRSQQQSPAGEFGAFLSVARPGDLSADYEVLPDAR